MIVGVDTRSKAFHWVASESLAGFCCGWTDAPSNLTTDEARLYLLHGAISLFGKLPPGTHVFVEEPLTLQNGQTTKNLCMAAAAVWCGFQMAKPDAWWFWVDVATWKKAVLGRGIPPREFKGRSKATRTKDWIRAVAVELPEFQQYTEKVGLGPEHFDAEPDLYDAWGLMQYGRALGLSSDKEMASSNSELPS